MNRKSIISRLSDRYNQKNSRILEENLIRFGEGSALPLRQSIRNRSDDDSGSVIVGDIRIGDEEYQFTKRDDFPNISELSVDVLAELPVPLLVILQSSISEDAHAYWEYTYSVFNRTINERPPDSPLSLDVWMDVSYLFDLALSDSDLFGFSHATNVLRKSQHIAAYVSYPVLEGLLKSLLDCVDQDGRVLTSDTLKRVGDDRKYYDKGDECHNLTDLLCHYEYEECPSKVSNILPKFRENLSEFDKEKGPDEAYGIITDWRGSAMHGELITDVQYGIILHLVCVILWGTVISEMPE